MAKHHGTSNWGGGPSELHNSLKRQGEGTIFEHPKMHHIPWDLPFLMCSFNSSQVADTKKGDPLSTYPIAPLSCTTVYRENLDI